MSDLLNFLPVFSETAARIRTRMDADANAGVDPSDPAYVDTREGSFYWDMTQVCLLECARLWDAMTEAVAAGFPNTAWGEYLDDHGQTFGLARNPALPATGTELFSANANGVLIPAQTQVSAQPSDPTLDAISFQTTQSGAATGWLPVPSNVTVTPSPSGGVLLAGTYIYHVTAYGTYGETNGSSDLSGVITTNAGGSNQINWSAVPGALGYRVYRTLQAGTLGLMLADVPAPPFVDTGAITPTLPEPQSNMSAGVLLAISALTPGSAGNLGANALTTLETPIAGVLAVTNQAPTVGGADVESDADFRARLLSQYQGGGAGTVADYVRWSLAWGVERVAVVPLWDGPGTVLVVAMEADGTPVDSDVLTGLQQYLDPVAGQGHGQAPVGASVTVATSTVLYLTISATVNHSAGYSLDGANGTIATLASITGALDAYIASLDPGESIGYQHVLAAFFVEGVYSISNLLVNGASADIALALSPIPQIAQIQTLALA
jgi:uncharacterized phage protein gp47/JayE